MKKQKIYKAQDGSAYWSYVLARGSYTQNGDYKEEIEANPDQAGEATTLVTQSVLSDEDENNLASYYLLVSKGMLRQLTPRQRRIWKLRFFNWCEETEIADELNITLAAVRASLSRTGEKIMKAIVKKRGKPKSRHFNDGFKKGVHAVGYLDTDKEMDARLEVHKDEVEDFYRKHPWARKGI